MLYYDKQTRRLFLKTLGGSLLALPFLPSLFEKTGLTAPAPVKRFVFFTWDNGAGVPNWNSSTGSLLNSYWWDYKTMRAQAKTSESVLTSNGVKARMTDISKFASLPSISLESLLPYKDKLLVIDGINPPVNETQTHVHGHIYQLTGNYNIGIDQNNNPINGSAQTNSIDALIAAKSTAIINRNYITATSDITPTELPEISRLVASRTVVNGKIQSALSSPDAVYNRFVKPGLMSSFLNKATVFKAGADAQMSRKQVLDITLQSFKALKNSSSLSSSDRNFLDSYMERLNTLYQSLGPSNPVPIPAPTPIPNPTASPHSNPLPSSSPSPSPIPAPDPTFHPTPSPSPVQNSCQPLSGLMAPQESVNSAQIQTLHSDFMKVFATAIKCQQIQVITFMMSPQIAAIRNIPGVSETKSDSVHTWAHNSDGSTDSERPLSQSGDANKVLSKVAGYYLSQIANFMQLLDEVEDPLTGETFLDRTLIVAQGGYGNGHQHGLEGAPLLILGGTSGEFTMGRYLNYFPGSNGSFQKSSQSYNLFLNSLLEAMDTPYSSTLGSSALPLF